MNKMLLVSIALLIVLSSGAWALADFNTRLSGNNPVQIDANILLFCSSIAYAPNQTATINNIGFNASWYYQSFSPSNESLYKIRIIGAGTDSCTAYLYDSDGGGKPNNLLKSVPCGKRSVNGFDTYFNYNGLNTSQKYWIAFNGDGSGLNSVRGTSSGSYAGGELCIDNTGAGCTGGDLNFTTYSFSDNPVEKISYRIDTDKTIGKTFGNWLTYDSNIYFSHSIYGDGNFALDFNCNDSSGNYSDLNEQYVILEPIIIANAGSSAPYNLDAENGVNKVTVNFTNLTNYFSKTPKDINWYINGTFYSDSNTFSYDFNAVGDYNVSLITNTTTGESSQDDVNISIRSSAQGISIGYVVSDYNGRMDVNFSGTSIGGNVYYWAFGDSNAIGKDVNKVFSSSGLKQVCLTVQTGDSNKTVCNNFYVTLLTIKTPKDELTGENLNNYSVSLDFNASNSFPYVWGDLNIFFFTTNNIVYRSVFIDKNIAYFPRNYSILQDGTSQTLQPYLLNLNSSFQYVLTVFDDFSQNPVQNVQVIVKKIINGTETIVEQKATDSAGRVLLSGVSAGTYYLYLYYGGVLKKSITLNPSATNYYATIHIYGGTVSPDSYRLNVLFEPTLGNLEFNDLNQITFKQTINDENKMVAWYRITIDYNGSYLYDSDWSVGYSTQYINTETFNKSQFSKNGSVTVKVHMILKNGKDINSYSSSYYAWNVNSKYNIFNLVAGMKSDIGENVVFFIAIIVIIFILIWLQMNLGLSSDALVWIAIILSGIFTVLGMIPLLYMIFAVVGGVLMYLYNVRSGG